MPKYYGRAQILRNEITRMQADHGRLVGTNPAKATQLSILLRTKKDLLKRLEKKTVVGKPKTKP